jgi:hypothetical protein
LAQLGAIPPGIHAAIFFEGLAEIKWGGHKFLIFNHANQAFEGSKGHKLLTFVYAGRKRVKRG